MRDRPPRGGPPPPWLLARYLGAAALLAVGADHLDQYAVEHYDAIPTIGALFALNAAAATLVAVGLAAPVERLSRRFGRAFADALALAGIAVAAGSLAGVLISERTSLFGFREGGYRPAIELALGLDAVTIVLLAASIALPGRPESTIVGRTWLPTSHPPSTKPRRRSWRRSGPVARPRSGK